MFIQILSQTGKPKKECKIENCGIIKEDIDEMFETGYYKFPDTPFWDGKAIRKVRTGTHCLWKNVPRVNMRERLPRRSTSTENATNDLLRKKFLSAEMPIWDIDLSTIAISYVIQNRSVALLQEIVVIKQMMFGPLSWRKSNAPCMNMYFKRNGHTDHITRQSIHDPNTRKAQVVTCDVVVGLVLCKSSDNPRVFFLV